MEQSGATDPSIVSLVGVNGRLYTQQECFICALEVNRDDADAWNYLAATIPEGESLGVGDSTYTDQECYVRALELNPTNSIVWGNLGLALRTYCLPQ